MSTFNEADHPRESTGKFTDKPQSAPEVSLGSPVNYNDLDSREAINAALVRRLDFGGQGGKPMGWDEAANEVTVAVFAFLRLPGRPEWGADFLSVAGMSIMALEPENLYADGMRTTKAALREYIQRVHQGFRSGCETLQRQGEPVPTNYDRIVF